MKKLLFFFYFLLVGITYSSQIITNGEVSYYFSKESGEIKDIKGDQLDKLDIVNLKMGIIKENKFYPLEKYYKEKEILLKEEKVRIKGDFYNSPFILEISFLSNNEIGIEFNIELEDEIKFVYSVDFLEENSFFYREKENYIYNRKIYFTDSLKKGVMVLSEELTFLEPTFLFVDILEEPQLKNRRKPYYIMDLEKGKNIGIIGFLKDKAMLQEDEKFIRIKKDNIEKLILLEKERTSIEESLLSQINILTSRDIIVDSISNNLSKIKFKNQLNLLELSYENFKINLERIRDIKTNNSLEELYYYYTIYKFITQEKAYFQYENLIRERIDLYIKNNYKRIYTEGDLVDFYYLLKCMKLLKGSPSVNYTDQIQELEEGIRTLFLTEKGLKNSRLSQEINVKNLQYGDILFKEDLEKILNNEKKYYNKILGVYKRENNQIIDINYNLDMIKLLKIANKKRESDLLLGKIESLIKDNNYYIPRIYRLDGINKSEIYGEELVKYLKIKKES